MRFSKAPLIATLMAVVLSLLVILPALAEQTDGQFTQGRTLSDELVVGVFANAAESQQTEASLSSVMPYSPSHMLGTDPDVLDDGDADPRDTFFNGRLYVSNQDNAFNTVLVTHREATAEACVKVTVTNANTGSSITLHLVPTGLTVNVGDTTDADTYYQNYFKVVDRDGASQVENDSGPYVCDDDVVPPIASVPTADADLARINASDGDKLTVRAGTRIQEIYVDGEAPAFSDISPADGARFKDAALSIGFEVRDEGSGLRHDGEDVVSNDRDSVSHDAADAGNTGGDDGDDGDDDVIGDGDGNTDVEPISKLGGGSEDIDVTFYTEAQFVLLADYEAKKAAAGKARGLAKDAYDDAKAAAAAADEAAGDVADNIADPAVPATGARKAQADATAAADAAQALDTDDPNAVTALRDAATALGQAVTALEAPATALDNLSENPTSVQISQALTSASTAAADAARDATADLNTGARVAATAAETAAAAVLGGATSAAAKELDAAAKELDAAAEALEDAAEAFDAASKLEIAANEAEGIANTAEGMADGAAGAPEDDMYGAFIDDHGTSGWVMVERGIAYEANIVYNITTQGTDVKKYQWMVEAWDRVGNKGQANKNRFDLTVDTDKPQVLEARTGISYDVDDSEEVRNRSYIALTFVNGETGGEDPIAASTLDVRDFIIAGYEVLDIIQPELIDDDEKDGDGEYVVIATAIDDKSPFTGDAARDPRSRVYLKLDAELGSAETPRIQILGGAVTDLAGNQNSPPQNVLSDDKIPAGLTITVTSSDSSSGRTVATEDGTFTITVDADEPLRRTPILYFTGFGVTGTAAQNEDDIANSDDPTDLGTYTLPKGLKVSPSADGTAVSALEIIERDRAWTGDYDADDLDATTRVLAVVIWSEDLEGNAGSSSGWTNASVDGELGTKDTLKLAALDAAGLLIEIDRGIARPEEKVLPSLDEANPDVTESANPYLQLKFNESKENTADLTFMEVKKVEGSDATATEEAVEAKSRVLPRSKRPSQA